jgi:hypothetical protein
MSFQVLSDDGKPLDAHFDVDGDTLIFHSRGGSKGKDARNADYSRALRLLLRRLTAAGYPAQRAWVDSNRVQSIAIAERLILDERDASATSDVQVSRMAARMQVIGRPRSATSKSDHGNATKRIRLQLSADVLSKGILSALKSIRVEKDFRSERRLPVSELEKVTAEHLWRAVHRLRHGYTDHRFGDPTDYEVLLEDGLRLPPKAVFGVAASEALAHPVEPGHFTAGLTSPCFRILRDAGYVIVEKGHQDLRAPAELLDVEFSEGTPKLRKHLRRERAAGLPEAKKVQFRRNHDGRLFCERCGEDPVEKYGTLYAVACIEVHHAKVQVSKMRDRHTTRLEDLQCLCANCHRLVHREMRGSRK